MNNTAENKQLSECQSVEHDILNKKRLSSETMDDQSRVHGDTDHSTKKVKLEGITFMLYAYRTTAY